jgi:hypothetical protein
MNKVFRFLKIILEDREYMIDVYNNKIDNYIKYEQ